ncbi:MAG: DUF512 domain-containing protein [Candidatus Marinimicrobia bacterium]|nr:DUF512 domain-containing protein [Candidatus Neomarinimicrobiota bacterium]MBL7066286.1 DUF512 domain-containing protein [Candidatus Neomarinimicrobiota bacterium]
MIKIISVKNGSRADVAGICANDYLISLNGHEINDLLDYHFCQAEENLTITFSRNKSQQQVLIQKAFDEDLGIEVDGLRVRACSNNCIFCFIKQNPPGMRQAIYFCDEDYRYSFLYGSYITLTDLNDKELYRIVEQRLSPLYISVHATEPDVRKSIFRFRFDDRLMEKIDYLHRNRIELHTQIVLMPGMNDGEILEKTITDLYRFRDSIKTLALVPVGLTRHRKKLPHLNPVTKELASELVYRSEYWNRRYRNNEGDPFVYLSDEFYLLANQPFPITGHYGPYYQVENGVGLCQQLIDSVEQQRQDFPKTLSKPKRIGFITSKLAEPVLCDYLLPYLNMIANLTVETLTVTNHFFGETVTVSGLLTGQDIVEQFPKSLKYDLIFLPPRCINEDGLLLDDMTPEDIGKAVGSPVLVGSDDIVEMVTYGEM